jgi:hypothetical protein
MSRARALRARRIVEFRASIVDRVEVELGNFVRRTAEAAEAVRLAQEAWQAAVSEPAVAVCSSGDLVQAYDYRLGLARSIEARLGEERKARLDEGACRKRLTAAKLDLKKIEMWRDGLLEERKSTDEVAARIARTA